mmetsp:Transcript_12701/g.54539  ORF Transcript_12701/g.54539 Transcript_12701/m.54539 type:complete len:201 (+) Transcript_12701:1805-2407(+)
MSQTTFAAVLSSSASWGSDRPARITVNIASSTLARSRAAHAASKICVGPSRIELLVTLCMPNFSILGPSLQTRDRAQAQLIQYGGEALSPPLFFSSSTFLTEVFSWLVQTKQRLHPSSRSQQHHEPHTGVSRHPRYDEPSHPHRPHLSLPRRRPGPRRCFWSLTSSHNSLERGSQQACSLAGCRHSRAARRRTECNRKCT